ncbi:putative ribosomal large subunit pseudouridine synthase SVR1, chloroplastic isoform X2 [Beta vulgaris subsp. vulgaris]|uniref:putative ribosomal large subunit pseudouridine synthase SVR1, chloroplastic isoform X2 n=1 Tax=Beta vulgaris subsp. vulgaris TaxID=3555 RepID=UPI00053FDE55|nr:putative ribosomal large subunit pseudouridine synthase SVR1, chloroplastic isoform X2 [Beta vulgaris subsp. vulgaris]
MAAIALSSTSSSLANTTSLLTRLSFLSSVHHLALTLSPPLRISLNSPANARAIRAVTNSATKNAAAAEKKPPAQPRYSKAARRYFNDTFGEKPQRLAKVLAAAGVASRRSSEELIFQGKVTVNGSVCETPQTKVDPAKDVIYVKGRRLPRKLPAKVYLALNKPKGYICSSGEKEFKSVLCLFDDFLKDWNKNYPGQPKPRLFTVGRLDVATTGLIIVTNDGEFAQRVSHPSSNLTKEYIATVNGEVHKRHLVAINKGTTIDGVHCVPEYVELLPRQPEIPRARLRIVVNEGRNHEVRELVRNAELEIHSLKRIRIGDFKLSPDLGFELS